jgi:hypothetical protein
MAHYPTAAGIEAQLTAQGDSNADLLAPIIEQGAMQDAFEYSDPANPSSTLIDGAAAWSWALAAGLIDPPSREPRDGGMDDGRPG